MRGKRFRLMGCAALALVGASALAAEPPPLSAPPAVWDVTGRNADGAAVIEWRAEGANTLGFRWEQFDPVTGRTRVVAPGLTPVQPRAGGAALYRLTDAAGSLQGTSWYRVTILDTRGATHALGPFELDFSRAVEAEPARVAAASEPPPPSPAALTEGDAMKIKVREDALYLVTASNIAACLRGLDYTSTVEAIATTNLSLTHMGASVAWTPAVSNDGIVFYGQAIDSLYTRDNVYLLQPGTGVTMAVQIQTGTVAAVSNQWFVQTLDVKENRFARPDLFYDEDDDFWLWQYLYFPSYASIPGYEEFHNDKSVAFVIPDPAAGVSNGLAMTVRILGDSTDDATPGFDHNVTVTWTNASGPVAEGHAAWNGGSVQSIVATPGGPGSPLDGTNWLRMVSLPTGATYALDFLLDAQVIYPRACRARNDALVLNSGSNTSVTVRGLSTGAAWIADVSSALAPVLVQSTNAIEHAPGDVWVSFLAPQSNAAYAVAATLHAPYALEGFNDAGLRDATNAARFVIITVPSLESSAAKLSAKRESEGLSTRIVFMADIHNGFGQGIESPWNIRTFLFHARTAWRSYPEYVLLGGAGTYDYTDNLGLGAAAPCLVPPVMVSTPFGLHGCDNPLADLDGDGQIDIAIGRLDVATTSAFDKVVAKGAAYQTWATWRDQALFVASNPDDGGDFHATSDAIATHVPPSVTKTKLYLQPPSPPGMTLANLRSQQQTQMNAGVGWYMYMGHGNRYVLANQSSSQIILQTTDLPNLTNHLRPTVLAAMTCQLGDFTHPNEAPLGEGLVTAKGGAVALWAPTAESFNSEGVLLGSHLFDSVYSGHAVRLGLAVKDAFRRYKQGGSYVAFLLDVFALQGDPTLVLAPVPFSYATWSSATFTSGQLTDPLVSDPLANPDGDELVNAAEFAFNTSPTNFSVHPFFTAVTEPVVEGGQTNDYVKVQYERRIWREGIDYLVEVSYDLPTGAWSSSPARVQQIGVTPIDSTLERVTVRLLPALQPGQAIFVRMKIQLLE